MSRITWTVFVGSAVLLMSASCGQNGDGQMIDVSTFDEFAFDRAIQINQCFSEGDLINVRMTSQAGNRLLTYSMLVVADLNESGGDGSGTSETGDESSGEDSMSARALQQTSETDCAVLTAEGLCLVAGESTTRVLVQSENQRVNQLFARIVIANEPHEFCAAGNLTLCSQDLYEWDGLTASADFCQSVHVQNAFEVMSLLEDLRDGPPSESEQNNPGGGSGFTSRPVEILRTEQIMASDQLLGKNGDFVVLRKQSDLDGVLLQDGSVAVDFASETGIAVVVIRGPCQEFTGLEGTETALTVDLHGTLQRDNDCVIDLGSIDAWLIVVPRTAKLVRLYLNNSELDEIHL